MNPELEAYVAQCRARGLSDENIRSALVQAGWQEQQIEQVLPKVREVVAAQESSSAQTSPVVQNKRRSPAVFLLVFFLVMVVVYVGWWVFSRRSTSQGADTSQSITIATPPLLASNEDPNFLRGVFGDEIKRSGQVQLSTTVCKSGAIYSRGDAASRRRADGTSGRPLNADGTFTTYTTPTETTLIEYKNSQGEVCLRAAVLPTSKTDIVLDPASTALAVAAPLGAITTESDILLYQKAPKMSEFTLWLSEKLRSTTLSTLLHTGETGYTAEQAELIQFVSVINQQVGEARRR